MSGFNEPGEASGDGWRLTVPSPEPACMDWAENWVELPAGSLAPGTGPGTLVPINICKSNRLGI